MPRSSRRAIASVALAVITVGVGGAALTRWISTRTASGSIADRGHRTIAVLPFENVGAPREAYLADGVTDELTSRLANLQSLRVISPRSTREYRGTSKAPTQVGRELAAEYLL